MNCCHSDTGNYSLVIINTNKTRSLADSKYNERFAQCGAALKALKKRSMQRIYAISTYKLFNPINT
jgi:galactokinase